ncbi:hypothetical protein LPJ61_001155 [Coemansia biformis]|uniref:DUF4246 domain-containing protein n=1 Tax=Coemansia biformis TaxID=1286918 RepID=A0A9W7YEW1_9FUNG|nr:hypothetical protein LPJ61_001155 [Coemansia biformis]
MSEILMLLEKLHTLYSGGTIFTRRVNPPSTLTEQRMRQASSKVRARESWLEEASSVTLPWEEELSGLNEKEAEFVVDELWFFASLHMRDSDIRLTVVNNVWGSDSRVSELIQNELYSWSLLIEQDNLEDKTRRRARINKERARSGVYVKWQDESGDGDENEKDGDDTDCGQVKYMVDPSMYPLIYCASTLMQSRIRSPSAATRLRMFGRSPGSPRDWNLELCGGGGGSSSNSSSYGNSSNSSSCVSISSPASASSTGGGTGDKYSMYSLPVAPDWAVSPDYCWLPTEFQLDRYGRTTVSSYINNLSPAKYTGLYSTIEKVFSAMVPLLEQVLTDLAHPRKLHAPCALSKWWSASSDNDSVGHMPHQRRKAWNRFRTQLKDPLPNPRAAPTRPIIPYTLWGHRLQAIVEMSDIVLSPESPEHNGQWKVDGMANERIIATGILHFAAENIDHCTIGFREPVQAAIDYDSNSSEAMHRIYGLAPEEGRPYMVSRPVGEVSVAAGSCIVYPNTYQHRMQAKLTDPTRPGSLKRLVFYFVDPSTRIPSTELVPPQQRDSLNAWNTGDIVATDMYLRKSNSNLSRFSITSEQAVLVRSAMMEEHDRTMASLSAALFEPELRTS